MATFDDFLNEQDAAKQLDRSSLLRAAEVNPDEAAEAQRLAAGAGLPVPLVQRNLPDVRKQQHLKTFESFLLDNPELSQLSRDDNFLSVAQDQTAEMGGFKQTLVNLRSAVNRMTGGVLAATGGLVSTGANWLERNVSIPEWLDVGFGRASDGKWRILSKEEMQAQRDAKQDFFSQLQRIGAGIKESAEIESRPLAPWENVQDAQGVLPTIGAGVGFIAEQTVLSVPEMLAAYFTPWTLGVSYAGQIADERRTARGDEEVSGGDLGIGALAAVPMALLNRYGAEKVLGAISELGRTAARRIVAAGVAEGVTEITQDQIQYVAERVGIDPIDLHEMLARIPPTFVGAAGAGATLRGGVETLAYGAQRIAERARRAQEALNAEQHLAELSRIAEAMKLRERSPEQFEKFVNALDQNTELYVAPQDLVDALNQSGIELPQELQQRVDEAAEAATPVRFTVAEYTTYLTPAAAALTPKLRIGAADALTAEEAKNIEAEFSERAEKLMAQAQDADRLAQEGEMIRQQVQAQIVSTGRFRADVADAYAALVRDFFVATSQAAGVSPAELYARYPLRIQATPLDGDATLDQLPPGEIKLRDEGDAGFYLEAGGGHDALLRVQRDGNVLRIRGAEVGTRLRGQGVGQQLLMLAYREAQRRGLPLQSDSIVSAEQLRVYDALRRKGWTIEYANPAIVQSAIAGKRKTVTRKNDQPVVTRIEAPAELMQSAVLDPQPLNEEALQPVAFLERDAPPVARGYTRFRHYGNFEVPVLDPAFQGTGLRGAERKRSGGPKVLSLYPESVTQPEPGVGPVAYFVDIPTSRIYDASADPLNLKEQAMNAEDDFGFPVPGLNFSLYEQLIRDAGFLAYTVAGRGEGDILAGQARVFEPIPVVGAPLQQEATIPRAPEGTLSEEDRAIETRFANWLANNFDEAVEQYNKITQPDSSDGGRVLNTDIARELSPDYRKDRSKSAAVHEPASWFIKQLYEKRLREAPEGPVLVTAGGAGAGKSTALKGRDLSKYPIIYDTNLAKVESGKRIIDQALAAGRKVEVAYVYGDPLASFRRAIGRAQRMAAEHGTGRTVPITAHAASHAGSRHAVPVLEALYADDPRVEFDYVKSGEGKVDVEQLPELDYNAILEVIRNELEEQRAAGSISEAEYRAFRGAEEENAGEASQEQAGGVDSGGPEGIPRPARLIGLPESSPGPIPAIREAARRYVASLPEAPIAGEQTTYVPVVRERAERIAREYERAKHDPENPEVQAAYDALIRETLAQFQIVKQLGLHIEFIKPGQPDPYPEGPKQVLEDLRKGHLWVFPTDLGFGQSEAPNHPLLQPTDEVVDGRVLLANDVFRIVHDVFGHGAEGVGFGPVGEENAFQAHVRMYTPLAARALTTETRGQNSWVNYGPYGEANRANPRETIYAEQKATLLPEWVTTEGVVDSLDQRARGQITLGRDITVTPSVITLLQDADLSTFLHEAGHFFFEVLADLAARPNAPAQFQQDIQTLFDWVGFKGTAAEWRALPIDQRREAHEQFARGFEAWLLEGRAPSPEQRKLFQRFRAWLLHIYKSLQALNVRLTDEVRSVMGRMIATREQVLAAEAERGLEPLFPDAQAAHMTPEEWQQYQDNWRVATDNAQDQLQARSLRNLRWLANARAKELRKLQKENAAKRAEIRAEVEAEIAQRPERVAETLLLTGEAHIVGPDGEVRKIKIDGPHKLSTKRLAELYGTTQDYRNVAEAAGYVDVSQIRAPWHALPKNLVAKEGLDPEVLAELVGFTSGDQLVMTLISMAPREELIEQITDARVLQRYGDLNNAAELERAVDIALHNQMRTRMVATELAALEASTTPGRRDALRRAAREFAERVVQRKKIRDLRPSQFAAAEAQAAREAQRALAAGNNRLAAARKRDQLFNGYASRAASRAQDSIEKGLRYLNSFNNPGTRKNLDPGYRDQIDKLLERFDLKARSLREIDNRTSLANWIKEQQELGNEPAIPDELMDEAQRTHYRNLTVEQFEGLVDAVRNIEHLARLKNRLLKNARQRDFEKAKAELVASIEQNAPAAKPEELERDASIIGKAGELVTEWLTSLRKLSSIVRVMDGGKDGGLAWEYFVRPLNDAADAELRMRAEATKKLNELLNMVPGLNPNVFQRVGRKIVGNKKLFIPAINKSLSLEARIAVALNAGNDGNKQRLMEGNRWTEAQVQAVIDTLTKQEMDFVQAVLDFIGSYWPAIKAKEERVSGVSPKPVAPTPIRTRYGEYRGGYYPIVADPMRSDKAAQQNEAELIAQSLRGAVTRATTRRGHTKERVGGKDPVRLDLGVIAQHISQVTHDLAWHETLIDYNKMLRDREVSGLIRERYGASVLNLMRRVVDDVARGEVAARTASERILNYLRVGSTITGLGLNVMTTLLQLSGFSQSVVRVGYRHIASGILQYMAHPVEVTKQVYEKSTFMRDRSLARNRELGEIFNRLDGRQRPLSTIYFLPIQAFQTVVDVPTWLGAYNKALQNNETDERAVALADQAVRDSQSAGHVHDLAEIQRGGPLLKLFTNFYSYFSATYQLAVESAKRVGRERTFVSVLRMMTDYLMLVTVPVAYSMLLKEALRGDDDDDDDELPEKLVKEHISYAIGMFPLVREVGGAIEGFDYRGPAGLSFFGDVSTLIQQAQQGEVDEAFLRALNRTAGTLLHYPAGQVDRTVRGMVAVAEGDAGPQAILVGPPVER